MMDCNFFWRWGKWKYLWNLVTFKTKIWYFNSWIFCNSLEIYTISIILCLLCPLLPFLCCFKKWSKKIGAIKYQKTLVSTLFKLENRVDDNFFLTSMYQTLSMYYICATVIWQDWNKLRFESPKFFNTF